MQCLPQTWGPRVVALLRGGPISVRASAVGNIFIIIARPTDRPTAALSWVAAATSGCIELNTDTRPPPS